MIQRTQAKIYLIQRTQAKIYLIQGTRAKIYFLQTTQGLGMFCGNRRTGAQLIGDLEMALIHISRMHLKKRKTQSAKVIFLTEKKS